MKTIVLVDGQNLYHLARELWAPTPHIGGSPYGYPCYDVEKLADALVKKDTQRTLSEIRFLRACQIQKKITFGMASGTTNYGIWQVEEFTYTEGG